MRRSLHHALLIALLGIACHRESPKQATPQTSTAVPTTSAPSLSTSAPAPPIHKNRSTPQQCAGDGSYAQAVDCFRISSGFHFVIADANDFRAEGEMSRKTPGLERVHFKAGDGEWLGEAKPTGVTWMHNGKHDPAPPESTTWIWQRVTLYLDPQKKEGAPQFAGMDNVDDELCNHYHFTNANTGEANDVWVSKRDGHIVYMKAGTFQLKVG